MVKTAKARAREEEERAKKHIEELMKNKLMSSNNINNFWDGIFNGSKLQPHVFDFYLEMTCYGGKVFFRKGNITLIK